MTFFLLLSHQGSPLDAPSGHSSQQTPTALARPRLALWLLTNRSTASPGHLKSPCGAGNCQTSSPPVVCPLQGIRGAQACRPVSRLRVSSSPSLLKAQLSGLLWLKPPLPDLTVLGHIARLLPSCVPYSCVFSPNQGHKLQGAGICSSVAAFLTILYTAGWSSGGSLRGWWRRGALAYPGMSGHGWTSGSGPGRCSRRAGSSGALGKRGAMSVICLQDPTPDLCSPPSGTGGLWGHPTDCPLHAHC